MDEFLHYRMVRKIDFHRSVTLHLALIVPSSKTTTTNENTPQEQLNVDVDDELSSYEQIYQDFKKSIEDRVQYYF